MDGRQPPAKPPLPKKPSSALSTPVSTVTPQNGSRAVAITDRPPALVGVAIPGRDRTIRRMVVQLYRENTHLPSAARGIAADYCKVLRASERVYQRWQRDGFPPGRDADLFMKASAEARHHASVLGLTPVSMASLGVDLGRMRRLAPDDGEQVDEAEIVALEGRLVDRLRGDDADDGKEPP